MNIEKIIKDSFNEALKTVDAKLLIDLNDEAVLMETGLDSLGFAILVTLLEEKLDFDPFASMDEAFYPVTYGEFVTLYSKHYQDNQN